MQQRQQQHPQQQKQQQPNPQVQHEPRSAPQIWDRNIQSITTKVLTTTGGTVWGAAGRCRDFLEAMSEQVGLYRPGVRVLELGAGCGTLGLTLARNLPAAAQVCLTEQAYGGALDHLRRNVAANSHLPNMASVTCCACDWSHFMDPDLLTAAAAANSSTPAASASEGCCQRGGRNHCQQQQQQEEQESALGSCKCDPAAAAAAAAAVGAVGPDAVGVIGPEDAGCCTSRGVGVSKEELRDLQTLLTSPWDVIVGSDLVYNTAGAHALPKVLAALMQPPPQGLNQLQQQQSHQQQQPLSQQLHQDAAGPHPAGCRQCLLKPPAQHTAAAAAAAAAVGPVMYYAHTKHRYDAMDVLLTERLAAEGLSFEEVVETGKDLPPPSPPPFSSLFPDMRCAVFKIYRAS